MLAKNDKAFEQHLSYFFPLACGTMKDRVHLKKKKGGGEGRQKTTHYFKIAEQEQIITVPLIPRSRETTKILRT